MSDGEELIRAVERLSLTVMRLDKRIDSRFQAFEKEISDRLETVERQVDEIGGGLAVVLSRSEGTKKKLPALPTGFKSWLSASVADLNHTRSVLQRWNTIQQSQER
jgi:hypothetical protein